MKGKIKNLTKEAIFRTACFLYSKNDWRLIESNNSISGYKRIYHYHIRKTGGTSLNQIFLRVFSQNDQSKIYRDLSRSFLHRVRNRDKIFVGWNKYLIEKGNYHYAFSHLSAHSLSLPEKTFTITILRDPIKRLISHYSMLKEYKDKKKNHACMKTEGRWLGKNFNDFLDNIPKRHLLRQLYFFSKNFDIDEAYRNITKNCSYYFFTEDFGKGVSDLNKILNLKMKNDVQEKETRVKFIPDREEINKLSGLLKLEIELIKRLRDFKKDDV